MAQLVAFAPEHFCRRCRTPFNTAHPLDAAGICLACRIEATQFDAAYCYGAYEGVLPKLIHLMKYAKVETLVRPLGELLVRGYPRDEHVDVLVPVPMTWLKRFQRGFNQSERLARVVSRATGVPLRNLLRSKGGAAQAGLTSHERRLNVSQRFSIRRGARVAGQRVMLIDDVFTTGATLNACARVLKRAGAARVIVLTLARADRRRAGFPNSLVEPVAAERGPQ